MRKREEKAGRKGPRRMAKDKRMDGEGEDGNLCRSSLQTFSVRDQDGIFYSGLAIVKGSETWCHCS